MLSLRDKGDNFIPIYPPIEIGGYKYVVPIGTLRKTENSFILSNFDLISLQTIDYQIITPQYFLKNPPQKSF